MLVVEERKLSCLMFSELLGSVVWCSFLVLENFSRYLFKYLIFLLPHSLFSPGITELLIHYSSQPQNDLVIPCLLVSFCFCFLAALYHLQDLSYPIRNQTQASLQWKCRVRDWTTRGFPVPLSINSLV